MKKFFLGLLALVALFLAVVSTRPSTFHVERSSMIAASPEVVYDQVANFHNWAAWSPWEKLDPNMQKTFEGPEAGEGASYAWSGNKDVGQGKMTVTGAVPPNKLDIKLEFLAPWKSTNATTFAFDPSGDGTNVTWSMDGTHDFMGKAMSLFMNMDQMIGKDFEKGLGDLNGVALAEMQKRAQASATETAPLPSDGAPAEPATEGGH